MLGHFINPNSMTSESRHRHGNSRTWYTALGKLYWSNIRETCVCQTERERISAFLLLNYTHPESAEPCALFSLSHRLFLLLQLSVWPCLPPHLTLPGHSHSSTSLFLTLTSSFSTLTPCLSLSHHVLLHLICSNWPTYVCRGVLELSRYFKKYILKYLEFKSNQILTGLWCYKAIDSVSISRVNDEHFELLGYTFSCH